MVPAILTHRLRYAINDHLPMGAAEPERISVDHSRDRYPPQNRQGFTRHYPPDVPGTPAISRRLDPTVRLNQYRRRCQVSDQLAQRPEVPSRQPPCELLAER